MLVRLEREASEIIAHTCLYSDVASQQREREFVTSIIGIRLRVSEVCRREAVQFG